MASFLEWNPQQDYDLRTLCDDRALTYGEIARRLTIKWGVVVSRSAIGQRARRQGFREHKTAEEIRQEQIAAKPQPVEPVDEQRWKKPKAEPPRFSKRVRCDDPEPFFGSILLLEASEGDCRFPVAGSGINLRVCGAPRRVGAYCETCAKRAYLPEKSRGSGSGFALKSPDEAARWREKHGFGPRSAVAV